jgi:hypothetical protein
MKKLTIILLMVVSTTCSYVSSFAQVKDDKMKVKPIEQKLPSEENAKLSKLLEASGLQKQNRPVTKTYPFVDAIGAVDVIITTQEFKDKATGAVTQQVRMEFKRASGAGNKANNQILDFAEDEKGVISAENNALQRGAGNCDVIEIVQSFISTGQNGKICIDSIKSAIEKSKGKKPYFIVLSTNLLSMGFNPCKSVVTDVFALFSAIKSCLKK